jgi:hypothetical protein
MEGLHAWESRGPDCSKIIEQRICSIENEQRKKDVWELVARS